MDTSDKTLGSVILQQQKGKKCPIAFASLKLNAVESRYVTIEKECLAIFWVLDYVHYYLLGWEFLVITDHAPLWWLA